MFVAVDAVVVAVVDDAAAVVVDLLTLFSCS